MKMNRFISSAICAICLTACSRHEPKKMEAPMTAMPASKDMSAKSAAAAPARMGRKQEEPSNTEDYKHIVDNNFKKTTEEPVSTFSIDVDKASYSNVRRFIESGKLPPADAVRVEELINYFDYNYPQPTAQHPLSITTDLTECLWKKGHYLLHVGLKGREYEIGQAPAMNLVFLIDVSGSMSEPNKLPLLKSAFELLINQLRPQDRVAMVVYAGSAGMVLPSTSGAEKSKILSALDKLQAGGSTAGGAGIELAYKIAQENFIASGNNRVILATDGDFNVGVSGEGDLTRLIEKKRQTGVFLSVMGFGMGNYKDSKLEAISQNGNGNYAYIDNLSEAKRVLGSEMTGTLFTIAKDVKLQIEFNPTMVESYRLIGYENRLLNREDFNNDAKDAGELGAGQTVTALYEIVPAKGQTLKTTEDLKYQQSQPTAHAQNSNEWVHIKFRYKQPKQNESLLLEQSVAGTPKSWQQASENVRFASAVAGYGMLLRKSEHKGDCTYSQVLETAKAAKGDDSKGYRNEFIEMVQKAQKLK